jgi:hypothetical protein
VMGVRVPVDVKDALDRLAGGDAWSLFVYASRVIETQIKDKSYRSTSGNSGPGSLVVSSPVPLCPFKWGRNSPLTVPHLQGGAVIFVAENVSQLSRA